MDGYPNLKLTFMIPVNIFFIRNGNIMASQNILNNVPEHPGWRGQGGLKGLFACCISEPKINEVFSNWELLILNLGFVGKAIKLNHEGMFCCGVPREFK